jgi:DNA-binding SARP family transcriptional activator
VEFRILGPLEVLDAGRAVPLGGAKQRAALAMLLLHRNQVVSRDRLIEGLWGDAPRPAPATPWRRTCLACAGRCAPRESLRGC